MNDMYMSGELPYYVRETPHRSPDKLKNYFNLKVEYCMIGDFEKINSFQKINAKSLIINENDSVFLENLLARSGKDAEVFDNLSSCLNDYLYFIKQKYFYINTEKVAKRWIQHTKIICRNKVKEYPVLQCIVEWCEDLDINKINLFLESTEEEYKYYGYNSSMLQYVNNTFSNGVLEIDLRNTEKISDETIESIPKNIKGYFCKFLDETKIEKRKDQQTIENYCIDICTKYHLGNYEIRVSKCFSQLPSLKNRDVLKKLIDKKLVEIEQLDNKWKKYLDGLPKR